MGGNTISEVSGPFLCIWLKDKSYDGELYLLFSCCPHSFVFCCGGRILNIQSNLVPGSQPAWYLMPITLDPPPFCPPDDEASHSVVGWTPCRGVAVACNFVSCGIGVEATDEHLPVIVSGRSHFASRSHHIHQVTGSRLNSTHHRLSVNKSQVHTRRQDFITSSRGLFVW